MAKYSDLDAFRGNTNIRRVGVALELTKEDVQEYIKCRNDPMYFIRNYVYITHVDHGMIQFKLFDFQEDVINLFHNNRKSCLLTARQQGKCLSINTKIKIKQKSTGNIVEISLGDFYRWKHFCEYGTYEDLQKVPQPNVTSEKDIL